MLTPGRAGGVGRGSWGAAWDHYNQIFSSKNWRTASPWGGGGRRRGRQWREVCGAQEYVLRSKEHEGHQHCQHWEGSATCGKIILQITFNLITIMIILEQGIYIWSDPLGPLRICQAFPGEGLLHRIWICFKIKGRKDRKDNLELQTKIINLCC